MLEEEASKRPENYEKFYKEFGIFLKEGAALDFSHREQLMKLLRFESSFTEKGKTTTLTDYVSRMPETQKDIYFLLGTNRETIESGPYLEGMKSRNLEVLFCYEGVDEYVMNNVREFDGKKLLGADRADIELSEVDEAKSEGELSKEDAEALASWMKTALGDKVSEVKISRRLVDSPVVALNDDPMMTAQMRRMMKAMSPDSATPPVKVRLEINPRHAVITHLDATRKTADEKAALVAEQLLDTALISAGLLEDPTPMVQRLYKILATA